MRSRFNWRGTAAPAAPAAPAAFGAAFSAAFSGGGGGGALWRGGSRVLVLAVFGTLRKKKFRCLSPFFCCLLLSDVETRWCVKTYPGYSIYNTVFFYFFFMGLGFSAACQ